MIDRFVVCRLSSTSVALSIFFNSKDQHDCLALKTSEIHLLLNHDCKSPFKYHFCNHTCINEDGSKSRTIIINIIHNIVEMLSGND